MKYDCTLLQLRGREDNYPDHGEPSIAEQAGDDKHHGYGVTDGDGPPSGCRGIHGPREQRSQNAAAVEGIGRQNVQASQIQIGPHRTTRQIGGLEERPLPKINARGNCKDNSGGECGQGQIDQRANQRKADLPLPCCHSRLRPLHPRFVCHGHSTDGQQNDRFGDDARARGGQHVPEFVGNDAGQNDAHQRDIAGAVGRTVRSVFSPENEQR